jgi:hypothetical protein
MSLRFLACCLIRFIRFTRIFTRFLTGGWLTLWLILPPGALATPSAHTVRLHYQRSAGDYDGWGLHVWGEFLDLGREVSWDKPLLPKGRDGFGIYFDIPVKPGASHVYFILHQENIKNFSKDIKWVMVSHGPEIWQLEDDGTIYSSVPKGSLRAPGPPNHTPVQPGESRLPQIQAQFQAQFQAQLSAEQQERQVAERLVLQREQELAQMQQEARRREAQLQEKIHRMNQQLQQAEQQLQNQKQGNLPPLWSWPLLLLIVVPALWCGRRWRQARRIYGSSGNAARQ